MKQKLISLLSLGLSFYALILTPSLAVAVEQPASPKLPIYFYLYARITDHVNLSISEDQVHRVVSLVEKYRQAHPEAHVSATLLFSGAVTDALAKRNSQSHIVDFVQAAISRGSIEAGYDGYDEPTYGTRPTVDITTESDPQKRWLSRKASLEKFLTEARDPLTGAPVPGATGGLKRMQQVFGEAACITGIYPLMRTGSGSEVLRAESKPRIPDQSPKTPRLPPGLTLEVGADSEAVGIIQTMNSKAVMFGLPDANPARIPGFRAAREGVSKLLSPTSETPSELYWQDNMLRTSETSNDVLRLIYASSGASALQKLAEKVDRTRVHVVHVELGAEQNYLQPDFIKGPEFPATQYAYNHPGAPQLPASALRPAGDVDAAFAKEDELLNWLTGTFLTADAGSRIVSSADLKRMVAPATGFSITTAGLKAALTDFMKEWGNDTYAPPLFSADGHYLTRAELFQVLVDALAEFHRSGKLPESVKVIPMYGPVRLLTGHGPNVGEASVATIAALSADIAPGLHEPSSGPIPKNAVPIGIKVEGAMLNPAQFLRLMASALLASSPETKINIRMTYEFIGVGQLMPRSRPDMDDGFIWTIKPAQLNPNFGR